MREGPWNIWKERYEFPKFRIQDLLQSYQRILRYYNYTFLIRNSKYRIEIMHLKEKQCHRILAEYFMSQPLFFSEKLENPNKRKCFEQPRQQIKAEMWDEAEEPLCNLLFIQAKAMCGLIEDVIDDMNQYITICKNRNMIILELLLSTIKLELHIFRLFPLVVFQNLYNYLQWHNNSIKKLLEESRIAYLNQGGKFLHQIRVPQIESSRPVSTFSGHDHPVYACAWSTDGNQIMSFSDDGIVIIWNVETQRKVETFKSENCHCHVGVSCRWSSNSDKILILDPINQRSDAWFNTGKKIKLFTNHRIYSWNSCGNKYVTCYDNNKLKIVDLENKTETILCNGHADSVKSCSWAPDDTKVASTSKDKTIIVWDAESGNKLSILYGHTDNIINCIWSPDGKKIVSFQNRDLLVWNTKTFQQLSSIHLMGVPVEECKWSPNSNLIAIRFSSGNEMVIWNGLSASIPVEFGCSNEGDIGEPGISRTATINAFAWSPDSSKIAIAKSSRVIELWSIEKLIKIETLKGHFGEVNACSWSPNGSKIVSVGSDNLVMVWDLNHSLPYYNYASYGFGNYASRISWAPDNNKIATVGHFPTTIKMWNSQTGFEILNIESTNTPPYSWSPDGKYCVALRKDEDNLNKTINTRSDTRTAEIYDATSNILVSDFNRSFWSDDLDWSADAKKIVWALNRCIYIKPISTTTNGYSVSEDFEDLFFSSDARHLIVQCKNGALKYYDSDSGKVKFVYDVSLPCQEKEMSRVIIAPDGKLFAYLSKINGENLYTIRVHHTANGSIILEDKIDGTFISWSPDGKQILTNLLTINIKTISKIKIVQYAKKWLPSGKILSVNDNILLVQDVKSYREIASFINPAPIRNCSVSHCENFILISDENGNILLLKCIGFETEPRVLTGVRLWQSYKGWDEYIKARCFFCAFKISIPPNCLDTIHALNRNSHITPEDSPILKLPNEAWDEPKLLFDCPKCGGKLKSNPFVVDNKGRWD